MEQDFKELTKIVYEIDKKMGIMIQRNDDFCIQNAKEHKDMNDTLRQHNGRLGKMEKWKWGIAGGLTVIALLLGWLWDVVKDKI